MKKPKISIITITLNSVKTIEQAIKSVINQNYDKLEYIIIDGCSTDGTLDIIDKYKEHIAVVVSEKDNGISDAFNKGILRATGDIVGIVNSDDIMLPEVLEKVALEFDGKTDIYRGNIYLCNPNTGFKCKEIPSLKFPTLPFFCHVAHSGMFVTLECFKKYGLYDTKLRYVMDLDFCIRTSKAGAISRYMDVDVSEFRSGGVTANSIFKKKDDYLYMVQKNGGNRFQAYLFFYFLVATQWIKKALNLFGSDFGQKLRYKRI